MLEGTDASFKRCFLGRRHIRVRDNVPVLVRLYIRLSVFACGIMLLSQVSLFFSYSYISTAFPFYTALLCCQGGRCMTI